MFPFTVYTRRLGDHLRCLLDVDPDSDPAHVHQLLRGRLRGESCLRVCCSGRANRPLQTPISPEILRVVASRVSPNDRNDHLLLAPETEEVGPYELPLPREVSGLETYVPAYLNVPHLRRLAALVA